MYHPLVVEAQERRLHDAAVAAGIEPIRLTRHPVEHCWAMTEALSTIVDAAGVPTRTLTLEEQAFVTNERWLCKLDYRYWAYRYCWINRGGRELARFALWESQELILEALGRLELRSWQDLEKHGFSDGVLGAILKGRQLGASTLSSTLLCHRASTSSNVFGVIAGDTPESGSWVFSMFERSYDNLPWWLRPGKRSQVRTYPEEIELDTGTDIWAAAGKSTRGTEKKRGQLGRGKTVSIFSLTEMSTWDEPGQIDDAFFPTVPIDLATLGILESTAKGRNDWWHRTWKAAKAGQHPRLNPIFIPWYAEQTKHRLPVREPDWTPSQSTLDHAKVVEETSEEWMHRRVVLTREQLYWYERTRAHAEREDDLSKFLEEYPANDEEAFQFSGRGIFKASLISVLETEAQKTPPVGIYQVEPHRSLVRALENLRVDDPWKIPSGYGLRPLPKTAWPSWDARDGLLTVWRLPRRGHRYVIAVDVGDGLGGDYSVIEVLEVGDERSPDTQVAQFYTNQIDSVTLSQPIDVIGRFFHDDDGTEALCAVEINNHGLATQSELQRHLGYSNLYVWRYENVRQSDQLSNRLGWYTGAQSRPIIISRFHKAVTTMDAVNRPDLVINSLWTLSQFRDFHVPPDCLLYEARAATGAHDDSILALAIANYVVSTLHNEQGESVAERRRRQIEERVRAGFQRERFNRRADFQNTDCTADEIEAPEGPFTSAEYGAFDLED